MPAGGELLRYGLAELLCGLGLAPVWTRRGDAQIVVAVEPAGGGLALPVTDRALADLCAPRRPAVADLGWAELEGERWPVPVGPVGESEARGDRIAAAAWWLAGLQERAASARDRHGRFPYAESLQAALGDGPGGPLRPAVDATRRWLAEALHAHGIGTAPRTWGGAAWAVALTHDLDAVRTRRLRALAGEIRRGRPADALRRALGPDRRRASIGALHALAERHGAAATWFVKPGAWTPHDVPGGLDPSLVGRLRRWEAEGHEVGWHPGYGTLGRPDRLATEAERFRAALGHPPALARTHFLRWADETPRALAALGVRVDSTLGFAERPGFRRGTAHPFRLFDLDADRPTDLWEVPLAAMDTTLAEHLGLGADGVGDALRSVFEAARRSGGVAVVLWHNQVGADTAGWGGGVDALDHALGQARADGARLGPLGALLAGWEGG
ncbi:hypothetical protein [Rubrivirga sp.]|uniref:hypothetical protein n=1 Tax=Rubrivirga sp. TaxID=1885344 RepID=UPI003B528EBD